MAQNEWAVVSQTPIARTEGTGWEVVEQKPAQGALVSGFKSYVPSLQETYGGLKTLLGVGAERVLGEGAISRGLIESGAASMAEAEKARAPLMTKERGSFSDALDKGVGSVLTEWLPFQAGAGAAQVLEALALVGAGGVAGTMTAPGPGTLAGAGTGLVARELAKRGVKEAAEKVLKERGEDAAKAYFEKQARDVALEIGKKRGQTAALAGQAAFYGTGQTTSRAVEEAEKLGGTATDIELARVLPAAAVSTVAEFIGDKIALGALKGIKPGEPSKSVTADLAKNILLNIGLTGTKEVPVEVIQSAAERFGAKLSLTDAQALKEYIDSAAASYAMAVGPGGVGGVRQTMAERAAKPEVSAPPAEVAPSVTTEAPAVEVPTAEAPPVEAPAAEPPVAETPPIEPTTSPETAGEAPVASTPPTAPAVAEPPPVEPPVTPKLPEVVTAQMLQDIGVRPSAAIVKRLDGLPMDDPKVATELESYANRFATPEAKPQILNFVQTLRQPVVDQPVTEAPVAPSVEVPTAAPQATTTPAGETTTFAAPEVPSVTSVSATPATTEITPAVEAPVAPVVGATATPTELPEVTPTTVNLQGREIPIALSKVDKKSGNILVAVDTAKADDSWKSGDVNKTFYIGPGGTENAIRDRYAKFGEFAKTAEQIDVPSIVVDEDGKVSFEDGRHRFAYMRDQGLENIPVSMSPESRANAIKNGLIAPEVSRETTPAAEPVTQPKTLEEFSERMPVKFYRPEVEAANNEGNFVKLTKALQQSANPAIRRIGQLGGGIASEITLKKPRNLGGNTAGVFDPNDNSIQMIPSYAGDEQTNAHETLHALIAKAQQRPTDKQKPIVGEIDKLYQHVRKELRKKGISYKGKERAYGLKNAREFTAEAMTNPEFQFLLMQIPYPGRKTAWTKFVRLVSDLLGIQNTNALTEVMNLVDRLATQQQPRQTTADKFEVEQTEARPSVAAAGNPGQQALETIRAMGMDVPNPDPTKLEKAKDIWTKAKEDPKLTAQSAARAMRNFLDKVETWSFSSDAKLNNDYRRAIVSDIKENEGVIGQLLEMSQSQAVHADALASQFMIEGGLKYNDELKKWESFDAKANFPALSKKLDEIGKQYNLSKEQIERVAHAYLVAKRLPGLIERNRQLDKEIAAEQATAKPDKKKIQDLEDKKVFISDKQLEQMEPGLSLGKTIPELNQVVDMWNDIRKNTIDVMVNSGLWSPEYAQAMWDNMDYVPYFREDQIENEKGPQEFIRGLQVKSKEFQLKGSEDAVHDVFDNMIRWTQYAINRSVRAHKALQMIDNAQEIQVGDRKMAEKVTEEKRGMNIVRVFRDGKQELYDMADPLYVQAFAGIQNVSIPTLKFMSKISDILRNSVVLYPLFSVAQVPQDSFAAMFTSGLKTQHALKIPYLAVKEFVKTLNKTSQTHETLKKFGATGVRDFSATVIRDDAEIYAGLKPPRGGWGKTKEFLSHISMAADNAVRQAVYEASIQQGVSRSEAIEKAFEVINFRRKGTSKMLNILGQTVPFFYAYLSAQRVAYKVLTGVGISPTDRAEAFKTLAMTSTAVATLSLLYAMANADDEDYMETPANIRDRTITIPGSGGVRIPLRPDFFLFPKIIAEHTYLLLADKGYQDAAKFKSSMKEAVFSAIASPTPFPTAIKPAIEVIINYDFFQGKPLIGNFEKQKDLERQFRDSTSEFSKLLGQTGMISPIAADHLIRGMFGSYGGLFLFFSNFLNSDPDVPRPEMNANEMLAALPGTSGLLKRPQESALKNDFYTLRDEVEKAVNTFNDIKTRSPEGMEAFLADEKNMVRLMLGKPVDKINRELSKIRRQITIITNMPESQMSAADKADYKRELMEMERELLRSVNVKELREMAKI